MVHLFMYGVREAMAQDRSKSDWFELPRATLALPGFRFSFSVFIAAYFHTSGFPIFEFPFS